MKSDVPRDPLVGSLCGQYRLESKIGEGGMGSVYRASQPGTNKTVAVKILRTVREAETTRVLNEARTVGTLKHPGIVHVLEVGELADRRLYMAMELLEGMSLEELLASRGRLPILRALAILDEVLEVLEVAHHAGVVHRDIKPANIFLATEAKGERVKVLDFGLAKYSYPGQQPGWNADSSRIVGTPRYMSPEQTTREAVGPRTDLYSVGVMTFEMVAGRRPFEGLQAALVKAHLHERAPALSTILPGAPPELDVLVARLLEKKPEDRPQSASEVREALAKVRIALGTPLIPLPSQMPWGRDEVTEHASALLRSIAESNRPAFSSTSPTAPSLQKRARATIIYAALAVLVIISAGGFGLYRWLFADSDGPEDPAWTQQADALVLGRIEQLGLQLLAIPEDRRVQATTELQHLREQAVQLHSDQERTELKSEIDVWSARYLNGR